MFFNVLILIVFVVLGVIILYLYDGILWLSKCVFIVKLLWWYVRWLLILIYVIG